MSNRTLAKIALFVLLLTGTAFGQFGSHDVLYVPSAPTGACLAGSRIQVVITTGVIYSCQNLLWTALAGGTGISSLSMTVPTGLNVSPGSLSSPGTFAITWSGQIPHAQLPTLLSGDIPNNAATTTGKAGGLSSGGTLTGVADGCLNVASNVIGSTGSPCGSGLGGGNTTSTSLVANTLPMASGSNSIVNSHESETGGSFIIGLTGAFQVSGNVQTGTTVPVPVRSDFSLFLGSDNAFRCQLASAVGCLTPLSIGYGTSGTGLNIQTTSVTTSVNGDVVCYDGSGNTYDCGSLLSSLANTSLSNLAAVGINVALTPASDASISLDSLSKRFVNFWASGVFGWTNGSGTQDTGLSRGGGGEVDCGNGTAADKGCTFKAANINASSSSSTGTAPVVCGTALGCYGATEGTAENMLVTASQAAFAPDATQHAFLMTLNGGAIFKSAMNASVAPTGTIAVSLAGAPAGGKCLQSSGTAGLVVEAAGACGSSTPSLDQVTGSAAQATATETAISHEWTYAGVETANLTYPIVFQNTNATNTTSGALAVNVVGAGTAMVPVTINQPTTDVGNIIQGFNGGTFTNGVESGGTINFAIASTGQGLFGPSAPSLTNGTSGGGYATEGTPFTGTSTNYGWYNDSTLHCVDVIDQTTNIGCAVGETAIIGANLIMKAVGTTSKAAASSITDNGTSVSTVENVVIGTAGGIPNVDKTIGFLASAMGAQTTATCTNITNMTWTIAANKNYLLECKIPMTLAATATIQYCLGGPGTATSYSLEADGDLGTAGIWSQISTLAQTAYGTKTAASAAVAANTIQHVSAAIQNGATASGTALTLQTAANGTNAITVGANATCTLTQAN